MSETKESLLTEPRAIEVKTAPKREEIDGYNPRKGFAAVIVSTSFISFSRLSAKHLFLEHANLTTIELLFYIAFLGFCFNIVWLNRNLKDEMYDSVTRELVP